MRIYTLTPMFVAIMTRGKLIHLSQIKTVPLPGPAVDITFTEFKLVFSTVTGMYVNIK